MSQNNVSSRVGSPILPAINHSAPESRLKKSDQAANGKNDADNPVIAKIPVSLENKPPQMPLGEHLTRQALNKLAADYGLSAADVELEIQYITEKEGGKFIENLNFGQTAIKNPNDLTDLQVAGLIKNGNKTVNFGIHQATVERMIKRDELVKWLAQKDEFGIPISEQDKTELAQIGYTPDDLAKFRDAKYMYYLGYRSQARAAAEERFKTLNDELRRKMVDEQLAKLEARPDSDFYAEGGEKITPDFERRRLANEIVNTMLGSKTPFEYERDRFDTESFEKRLAGKSYGDYLSSGTKTFVNSLYGGIGELFKGLALVSSRNTVYFDGNGKLVEPKVSDTLGYKAGEWIQQNVRLDNVDKDIERTFTGGTLPRTVGSLLPAVLGAWATKNPTATVAIYTGLQTGGNIYDEAKRYGATEAQAQKAALLTGGFVGLTSTIGYGKTLEVLNKSAGATTWRQIFTEAVKDGGRNAVVAGGQTIFENGVARQIYDPNRSYLENVRERMIAAGITGATLKGGLEIIAKVRMGKNPQTLAETQRIIKVKPESEISTSKQIELKNSGDTIRAKLNEKLNQNFSEVKKPIDNRVVSENRNKPTSDDQTRAALRKRLFGYESMSKNIELLKTQRDDIKNIPTEDLVAIKSYTGAMFQYINETLRTKNPVDLKDIEPIVKCAESGLNQLPSYKGIAYRGVNFNYLPKVLENYQKGKIVTEEAFTSSSIEKNTSFVNKDTMIIIYSKKGKDVSFLSSAAHEKEILFKTGSKFMIESVQMNKDGKREIVMREILDK